ncbi:MAG: DEAD/DEAH box helicase family protein [Candidatus Marinimicrobia bacterium]|nr:DEAD/DEAH box helicase family protein [Candidatus Neomarinimicrobiota bacterium]
MTFRQTLEKYRKYSFSERDKGYRFERLMQAYLQSDPKFMYLFDRVWLWEDFPGRRDLGGHDTGIDLVAKTTSGDYWAIQCKCYQESAIIDKPTVDSFLATTGRQFQDENLQARSFSHRLWISTTNHWGSNATEAIRNQVPPVTRLNLVELEESPVDWEKLDKGVTGEASRIAKKELRPHQVMALERTHAYFQDHDRGKLIMACGTGKTLTALRIAEHETNGKGLILFLVPSIALLGQTLREWTADALEPLNAITICSDPKVSRKKTQIEDTDTFSVVDLALPASTNVRNIVSQFTHIRKYGHNGMTVVFSTYQSIEVIAKAQQALGETKQAESVFDLIICDEAHRTTGVALTAEDSSAFIKVHDDHFIRAKKRLYMTATPRLYSDDAKGKAAQADAILCSMDDEKYYGEEIYRIGFGEAVDRDLLSDYKVLILTLSDADIPPSVQKMIADKSTEINSDDASRLVGCINALSKQVLGDEGSIKSTDPEPMRRAVAFTQTIKVSKKITGIFNGVTNTYVEALPKSKQEQMVSVASKHIDGTMSAPERDEMLSWLKSDDTNTESNECRVLTNVRCLSEGVDVPSLDAVMFLSARNSQVDVVQSVGRVMRKSPGKKYGYIIIPVVVPSNVEADKAMDDNERYKVVWTVLNALRAHDDRFNATVNRIELNRKRPDQILVGRPEVTFENGQPSISDTRGEYERNTGLSQQLAIQFRELQNVIFARLVQKVGSRQYWEQWAKNVAEIAERQVIRINRLIQDNQKHKQVFDEFLAGLQQNINPSITQVEAVEMLSQHIITKPVFEALFEGYSFVKNNPISLSMQNMLDLLEEQAVEKDTEVLTKFYDSVRTRAEKIDNAEGKQRVITELYDKFFKTAFPRMVEKLGIVYTPVPVVDFIIRSVEDVLKEEFDRRLTDENVHILDPFTGTGTFITRLLQSGLIDAQDLPRKYKHEIHANEIVLLAYYIAAVNIENAYHDILAATGYESFDGICPTDSFQLTEDDVNDKLFSDMFPQNSERVIRQKKAPLRVILGNPPYSVGQRSANDNAQNQKYNKLDARISQTYAAGTKATNKNSLYDSYIKAIRWSTDRLDKEHGGIICFVSNGAWIDGNAQDGLRKSLEEEFSTIYVFNLRGNQRTSGELSRREGGKIFGSGSRTPIAITLFVKKPAAQKEKATIYYHDIGDYLGRAEKLQIISEFQTVNNPAIPWKIVKPNQLGDWVGKRSAVFETLIPIVSEIQYSLNEQSFFTIKTPGIQSNRDSWVYNFSLNKLINSMQKTVKYYNEQVELAKDSSEKFRMSTDETKIKWTSSLISHLGRCNKAKYEPSKISIGLYRPFVKQKLYYGDKFIHRLGKSVDIFPSDAVENRVISVLGVGVSKEFSSIISNIKPDVQILNNAQCFPLYWYEEREKTTPDFFSGDHEHEYIRHDGITDFIHTRAQKQYGKLVTKADIFYYVYGFLHSPEYRKTFANDLKKALPRLPLVDEPREFWKFSKAGRALAELHINYESVAPYPDVTVTGDDGGYFMVEKMRFPKKGQKGTIIYNSRITISNIPTKAYDYIVNGKSAIEWVMERYQVKIDKASGIKNDPNDWAKEVGNPRYILDLLLSVINVSVQTVEIVAGLPKVKDK